MPELKEDVDAAGATHAAHATDAVDLQTPTAFEDAGADGDKNISKATARSRWRWRWRKRRHQKSAGDANSVDDAATVASGADI